MQENDLEDKVEGGGSGTDDEGSEAKDVASSIGTKTSAKDYQKELMANQPANRPESTSNSAQDKTDTGSRGAGPVGNMEGQESPPTREGGKGYASKV